MAGKASQPSRTKRAQKPYRQYGFRTQEAYEKWVSKYSSLPESDPRYFRRSLRGHARASEIARLKRIIKRTLSPAKEIRRKLNLLVYEMDNMSAFNFLDRYLQMMQALLRDPAVNDYDRRMLRKMMKKLQEDSDVNEDVELGEQLNLFG